MHINTKYVKYAAGPEATAADAAADAGARRRARSSRWPGGRGVAAAADSAAGDVRPIARSSRGPGGVGRWVRRIMLRFISQFWMPRRRYRSLQIVQTVQ